MRFSFACILVASVALTQAAEVVPEGLVQGAGGGNKMKIGMFLLSLIFSTRFLI